MTAGRSGGGIRTGFRTLCAASRRGDTNQQWDDVTHRCALVRVDVRCTGASKISVNACHTSDASNIVWTRITRLTKRPPADRRRTCLIRARGACVHGERGALGVQALGDAVPARDVHWAVQYLTA